MPEYRTGGSGLGLAICCAVVMASGGSVRVRASTEQGSTFELSLPGTSRGAPVRDQPFEPEGTAAPSPPEGCHGAAGKRRVTVE